MEKLLIFRLDECLSRALCIAMSFLVFSCFSSCLQNVPKQVRETRRTFNQDGSDWDIRK